MSYILHINEEKMRKLDAKSKDCVFIRYCEHSKDYKLYNPKNHKIIIFGDIIFGEGENTVTKNYNTKCFYMRVWRRKYHQKSNLTIL